MELVPAAVEAFSEKYTSPESQLLYQLNRETHLKVEQPHMLSGHVQGRLLSMISHMVRPQRILELGTYTGYSAICLAEGLAPGGILHTVDIDEELETMCRRYFEATGNKDRIKMHIGKAADVISSLDETFDLVFIDADKAGYEQYYDMVWEKLRPGAIILADNVLYHGQVLDPEEQQGRQAKAMVKFCEKVLADDRAEQVLLTIRDGLLVIRKK
ncbi:Predicted O-methyltransferase YrrM [Chitinophaga terrae (ex Kim and Jung 2007)]|uniref:Predicted O-methyltransferase YrrM n=1 Tax=Chitinophaga terrae (ex Kim and Jung 2007) TaxID=408074 RepID=A0A1H4DDQ8_9BACT|nr:O-methyltransferase [Chitinophaga terrae (ex Kim and Jung 2007)]MDQ0107732.1 putative O-methyltransferase YrrM [Chitinophaga terrae (ex Kim and Jung 2007)]GEP92550.1 O-methyltransferase [Chitinophaga terrae (ex Kim and Jung 2007)]SEA70864.1 Predicted O-methyltransferase YrrM [Chitinophaga terrae (ex Kim and Jung 2007)]